MKNYVLLCDMLINEILFCRPTGCTADVPGTAQFSRQCLEVEDSLQNSQEIKRTVQVLILYHAGSHLSASEPSLFTKKSQLAKFVCIISMATFKLDYFNAEENIDIIMRNYRKCFFYDLQMNLWQFFLNGQCRPI